MRTTINVKLQTGFFERTDFILLITADNLSFIPTTKDRGDISLHAANIKSVTFYVTKLKMEIQTDVLTDVYFANESDWFDAMKTLKEQTGVKIICEIN